MGSEEERVAIAVRYIPSFCFRGTFYSMVGFQNIWGLEVFPPPRFHDVDVGLRMSIGCSRPGECVVDVIMSWCICGLA